VGIVAVGARRDRVRILASVSLLDAAGVDFGFLGEKESCCGTPMLVAGKWEQFVDVMKTNIANVKAAGADTVISSCPACDMMWRQVYPQWAKKLGLDYGVTAKHYSEVISEKLASGEFRFPENEMQPVKVAGTARATSAVSVMYEPPRAIKPSPTSNSSKEPHHQEPTL
jgi:Fe-S oxidoreductase